MDENYKIYYLKDPITFEIRYVGLTKTSLKQRSYEHINGKGDSYKHRWIKSIKKLGLLPIIFLVKEGLTKREACDFEIKEIQRLKDLKYRLTNIGPGGACGMVGMKHTEEAKKKMSKAGLGRKLSEETKLKMSKSSMGKTCWHKGLKLTDEKFKKAGRLRKGVKHLKF